MSVLIINWSHIVGKWDCGLAPSGPSALSRELLYILMSFSRPMMSQCLRSNSDFDAFDSSLGNSMLKLGEKHWTHETSNRKETKKFSEKKGFPVLESHLL